MQTGKRSTEEYIILSLSGFTAAVLSPFVILRVLRNDWTIALLDGAGVLATLILFIHVYRTHRTIVPGRILAFVCVSVLLLTVELKGSEQLYWSYPALTAIFFLLTPKQALLLSAVTLLLIGIMVLDTIGLVQALTFYLSACATVVFSFAFADRMRDQQLQLIQQASKDPLTGAGNRRAMEQKLIDLMSFQRRDADIEASLLMIDIDKFKSINDVHGHAVGDEILVELIRIVTSSIRITDNVYRLGGEEFVIIAEKTPLEDAKNLSEKIRMAVELDQVMKPYNVTISVGTAQYLANESAHEWLGRADKAMYKAKNEGRNICCVA